MPKNDLLDLVLAQDNVFQEWTERGAPGGYFTSVHLDDDDTLRITLDYGDQTESYRVTVEEIND